MEIIKIITSLCGTIILIIDIIRIMKTKKININFCLECVFYFFYYIPIICDLFFGRPEYRRYYRGFIRSYCDFSTEVIYCITISYIIYMFHFFQKSQAVEAVALDFKIKYKSYIDIVIYIIFVVIIFTLIYIFMQIDYELFKNIFSYNMRNITTHRAFILKRMAFILIFLSLIFIVLKDKNALLRMIIVLPILFFACFLNGKRATVFLCVLGLLMIIILKRMIKSKLKLVTLISLAFIFLGVYVNYYAENVTLDNDSYMSYRVNFGRDDTLKMTIYSETKGEKILEYRGQTLLFYGTFFIRRSGWKAKPYPYATYFTSSLLNLREVRDLGWNMTTSIYDEVLSNLGWIGIILLPFFMNRFIKIITKRNEGILGKGILFLGIINLILLIAVQASAFLLLYILHIILIIFYDYKKRRNKRLEKKI